MRCAKTRPVWELFADVLVVQDDLNKVFDVMLVVVDVMDLIEDLVLGRAALKELEVVKLGELPVLEAAVYVPKANVVVEVHVVEKNG